MIVQQRARILDEERARRRNHAKRNARVKHHPKRLRIRLLERARRRARHGLAHAARHRLQRARHAHRVLDDRGNQRLEAGGIEARGDRGAGDARPELLVGDGVQDGAEDGVADGAAGGAEGANQPGRDAQLLLRHEQAGRDVGEGGEPGEAPLPEELQDDPRGLVVRDDGRVARREDRLDDQRDQDLLAHVLDAVEEGRDDPAADDAAEAVGDGDQPDLRGVVGVHVERGLREQGRHGVPDEAGHEDDEQVDGELAQHGEERAREERVGGDGEVVDEAGGGDERADADGRADQRLGVGRLAQVGQADQHDGETGGEEQQADPVQLLELVPARLVVVLARARGREVEDGDADGAHGRVDDGDVVAPAPGGLLRELVGDKHA